MQQEETSADLTPRLRRLTQNHSLITRAFAALSLFSIYTVATFYDTPGEAMANLPEEAGAMAIDQDEFNRIWDEACDMVN